MSKYHNKKVIYNDIKFDSIREKNRYIKLKEMEDQGIIHSLELQKKYVLQDKFKLNNKTIREISYIADFYYIDSEGNEHVEDVKGLRLDVYKIKKKLFEYKYKIPIEEI